MQNLSPIRFGVAMGIAGSFFYVVCVIFMATVPEETVSWLSNSLLHGIDVKSIMRESVPMQQSLVGILATFVGGCIFGALAACVYNIGNGKKSISEMN